jgi:glycosyltransferase involved in cell wall biosynthesis
MESGTKKFRVGIVSRSDLTGLGVQTRNLVRLLNPDKIMLIDSTSFNGNEQHPEIYEGQNVTTTNGFASDNQVENWIKDLDVVISCEIFYNMRFVDIANRMGVKTLLASNWEFLDNLRDPSLTVPTKLIPPSTWNIERTKNLFGNDRVQYLATPVFTNDFKEVREFNLNRTGKKRFLHVMGRQAIHDRNGTLDLVKSLQYTNADFELVIKAQSSKIPLTFTDSRITVDTSSPENEIELYKDFDAMILPRRYGGQSLVMSEALCAGLPVIMTDISPNNTILPGHWLAESRLETRFMTRTLIDLYSINPVALAQRIDQFVNKDLQGDKKMAYNIGYREYSNEILKEKWEKLINEVSSV